MTKSILHSNLLILTLVVGWVFLAGVLRWNGQAFHVFSGDPGLVCGIPAGIGFFFICIRAFVPQRAKLETFCWMKVLGLILVAVAILRPHETQGWSVPIWSGSPVLDSLRFLVILGVLIKVTGSIWRNEKLPGWLGFLSLALALPLGIEQHLTGSLLLGGGLALVGWATRLWERKEAADGRWVLPWDWGVAFLMCAGFLLVKLQTLGPTASDENVYFYQAWMVSQGHIPYRDFFFAHPPLHLALPALTFKVFGFSLVLAKSLAPLLSLGAGLCLWLTLKIGNKPWVGLLGLFLFLFATATLKASTNLTGVNTTLFFFLAGMLTLRKGKDLWAGCLLAGSISAGFYVIAPVLTLLLWEGIARQTRGRKLHLGFFATLFSIQGLFAWLGGKAFIEGVYTYHFLKPAKGGSRQAMWDEEGLHPTALFHNFFDEFLQSKSFLGQLYFDGYLWALAIGGLTLLSILTVSSLAQGERPRTLPAFSDGAWLSHGWLKGLLLLSLLIEFSMFQELHSHYFALVIPFLALMGAWLASRTFEDRDSTTNLISRWSPLLIFSLAFLYGGTLRHQASAAAWPDETRLAGEKVAYDWKESPVFPALDPLVKGLFWEDDRERGLNHPSTTHVLWSKKRWFSSAESIAALVQQRTQPHETLTGASSIAPLIALLAERDLAAHEADTNSKRFKSGILSEESFVKDLCKTPQGNVVGTQRSFFSANRMTKAPFWAMNFTGIKQIEDPHLRNNGVQRIQVYERTRKDVPCVWRK